MSVQLDLTPFLALAGGVAGEKAWEKIDEIYKEKRFVFYDLAKRSKYYNSPLIIGGDLLLTVYARKSLSILNYCFAKQDVDLLQDFLSALRNNKVFNVAIEYADTTDEINIEDFIKNLTSKLNIAPLLLDDDLLNAASAILMFLSVTTKKKFVENDFAKKAQQALYTLYSLHTGGKMAKLNIKNIPIKVQNKKLREDLFGNVKKEKDYILWTKTSNRKISLAMQLLFDKNNLSLPSIMRNLHPSNKDADTVIGLFESATKRPANEKDIDYLALLFYIHIMLKAYNLIKTEYFKNNKETMYVELEGLMNQVDKLRLGKGRLNIENERLKKQIKSLKNQTHTIQKLEKEVGKLKEQLKEEQKKNTELNALREFVFSLKTEKIEEKEKEIALLQARGVFVGGYDVLFAKLKPYLPNFTFVSAELNRFDEKLLNRADVLVIYPEVISHALYYFAVEEAKKRNIPLVYVSGTNINNIIKKIGDSIG